MTQRIRPSRQPTRRLARAAADQAELDKFLRRALARWFASLTRKALRDLRAAEVRP